MTFYISAGLFIATVLYIYVSSTMPKTGGGDALGDELGLYLWGTIALIFGVAMLITGWLKIKSIPSDAPVSAMALPLLIIVVAVGFSFWTYVQITDSGSVERGISVEVN